MDLTRQMLDELYNGLGLSMRDIGLLADRNLGGVSRSMRHHGLQPRRAMPRPELRPDPLEVAPPGRTAEVEQDEPPDAELVARLARAGRSAEQIASALKIPSSTTVRIIAQVLEVPLVGDTEPPPIPHRCSTRCAAT